MLIPINLIPKKNIKGILHIGAHEAEELDSYLKRGFENIIWVEANPQKYEFLEKKIESFPKMSLGKFAAGASNRNGILNIANNGQSSSLLELENHKEKYKNIFYNSQEEVTIRRIDSWLEEMQLNQKEYNFLNLDIQGFELEALKGMDNYLSNVDFIYTEVNFEYLYKNCCLKEEIDNFLSKYRFSCVAIKKTKYGWGDAIYAKDKIFYLRFYFYFINIYLTFFYFLNKLRTKFFRKTKFQFSIFKK